MSRLEQLLKLTTLEPNDPMTHYALGIEYINLAQWSDAIRAFGEAIRVDARYSVAYYHQARAMIAAGDERAAQSTLRTGIEVAKAAGDWHAQSEMTSLLDTIE